MYCAPPPGSKFLWREDVSFFCVIEVLNCCAIFCCCGSWGRGELGKALDFEGCPVEKVVAEISAVLWVMSFGSELQGEYPCQVAHLARLNSVLHLGPLNAAKIAKHFGYFCGDVEARFWACRVGGRRGILGGYLRALVGVFFYFLGDDFFVVK